MNITRLKEEKVQRKLLPYKIFNESHNPRIPLVMIINVKKGTRINDSIIIKIAADY